MWRKQNNYLLKANYDRPILPLNTDFGRVFKIFRSIRGQIYRVCLQTKNGKLLDCRFSRKLIMETSRDFTLEPGDFVQVKGVQKIYNFKCGVSESCGQIYTIEKIMKPGSWKIHDDAIQKRIEIIMHTNLSAFDGLNTPQEIVKWIKECGWKYLCVTDLNCVQAFPKLAKLADADLQIIYGVELHLVPNNLLLVTNANEQNLFEKEYVVFDLETTGLIPAFDEIIEFGGIKYKGSKEIGQLSFLIKSNQKLPFKIVEKTGITDDDLNCKGILIKDALQKIIAFIDNATLVAHNAIYFDFAFLNASLEKYGFKRLKNEVVDTLRLSWAIHPKKNFHNLEAMSRDFGITYHKDEAHRGLTDAKVLGQIWSKFLEVFKNEKITNFVQLNEKYSNFCFWSTNRCFFPTFVYAKNQKGLKLLYTLLSEVLSGKKYRENSHIPVDDPYFSVKSPRISMADLTENRQDLIIVNNPIEGDLINAAMLGDDEMLDRLIKAYDYIAISPPETYEHKIKNQYLTKENYEAVIKKIINFASAQKRDCIATSDAYYLDKIDRKIHKVLVVTKSMISERPHHFFGTKSTSSLDKPKTQYVPDLHLHTTKEMLTSFAFLGNQQLIEKIVVTNSQKFAKSFEKIEPNVEKKCSFQNPKYEKKLIELTRNKAQLKYDEKLHPIIRERIRKELHTIIDSGYGSVYWVLHLLTEKNRKQDNYLITSDCLGFSVVSWLLGISEINPLACHYYCQQCHHVEFVFQYKDGYDLEKINCPECGSSDYIGDGHNIPLESFFWLYNEKFSEITLDFYGTYHDEIHKFIQKEFGKNHVLRAGTLKTIGETTAHRLSQEYFSNYVSESSKELSGKPATVQTYYYITKIASIKNYYDRDLKKIIVFPKNRDVIEFTPISHLETEQNSPWFTTHLFVEDLSDNTLTFKIHQPFAQKILSEINALANDLSKQTTKISNFTYQRLDKIPYLDQKLMKLFTDLKVKDQANKNCKIIGLPDFDTKYAQKLLRIVKPACFADLIRLSGLFIRTDLYEDDPKTKLSKKQVDFSKIISCCEDIVDYFEEKGIDHDQAWRLIRKIYNGVPLSEIELDLMHKYKISIQYLAACLQSKGLPSRLEAVVHLRRVWKIAWCKLYWPLVYYAAYFNCQTTNNEQKDLCAATTEKIIKNTKEKLKVVKKNSNKNGTDDSNIYYQLIVEMNQRGFKILPISLNKSDATKYLIDRENNGLIMPLIMASKLTKADIELIIKERQRKRFFSFKDFSARVKIDLKKVDQLKKLDLTLKGQRMKPLPI